MDYQLLLGDCLEIMPTLGKVDAVITDPPYGEAICRNSKAFGVAAKHSRKATGQAWDDSIADGAWIKKAQSISKHQIIFGGNYYLEYLGSCRCYIVWDKRGNLPTVPFAPTEWAWTSYLSMPKKYTLINHGFITDIRDEKTGHPTQKPVQLMKWIIEDFTKPGDLILDPFMGSGTTGIAAMLTGRKFIGIEQRDDYFAIAEKRIADAARQVRGEFRTITSTATHDDLPLFQAAEFTTN